MANLENTDLLLVNRAGTSYTITGQEFKESVLDELVVQVLLDPSTPVINNDLYANATAIGGKAPDDGFVYSYQWTIADDVTGTNSSVIANTLSFIYLTADLLGKFIKCDITTTDAIGTTATGSSGYTEIEKLVVQEEPSITNVVLTQDQTNANRFTGNSFTSTVSSTEVLPNPVTSISAEVTGNLSINTGTDIITSNGYASGTSIPLTLNSATNLNNNAFEVGDVVKANESYSPQSSEIVSIGQSFTIFGSVIKNNIVGYSGDFAADFDVFLDGTTSQSNFSYSQIGAPYGFSFDVAENPIEADSIILQMNGVNSDANGVGVYVDTVNVGTYEQSNTSIKEFTINTSFKNIEIRTNDNASASNDYISPQRVGYRKDGVTTWIITSSDAPSDSILTLTDDTDIELFQADDVVQPGDGILSTGGTYSTTTLFSGSYSPSDSVFHDNDPNTGIGTDSGPNNFVQNDLGEIKSLVKVVVGYGDDGIADTGWNNAYINNVRVQVSNDNTNWVDKGICIQTNDDQTFKCTGNYRYVRLYQPNDTYLGVGTFKIYEVDPNDAPTVTSTDVAANTITVDGGNWDSSNQSEVWSDGVTLGSGNIFSDAGGVDYTAAMVFDGNDDTYTIVEKGTGNPATFIFQPNTPITGVTKIRVKSDSAVDRFRINDGSDIPRNTNEPYKTVYDGTAITLSKLEIERNTSPSDGSNTGFLLFEIEVNGNLLVDDVNDSQDWSYGLDTKNIFDGKTTTGVIYGQNAETAFPRTISNKSVTVNSSVQIYCNDGTNSRTELILDGVKYPVVEVADNLFGWKTVDLSSATLPITSSIAVDYVNASSGNSNGSSAGNTYRAIKVDGKLLIDAGVRDLGDSRVSTLLPKRGKGTISDITGSVVTIEPYTDNCFKEGQYLIHESPKTILVTPKSDAITDVTGDVLTFSGNKDLLNFAPGDTVSMVNADGTAATYNATTSAITNVEPAQDTLINWSSDGGWSGDGSLFRAPVDATQAGGRTSTNGGTVTWDPFLANVTKLEVLLDNNTGGSGNHSIVTSTGTKSSSIASNGGQRWETVYDGAAVSVFSYNMLFIVNGSQKTCDTYAFRINGNRFLVDPGVQHEDTSGTIVFDAPDENTLTFTDDTDLQYFKDGDLVQSGYQNVFYVSGNGGGAQNDPGLTFVDASSTVDVTSTSVQSLTYSNSTYTWMAIDLTDSNAVNDAYISFDVSGFITNYSIDGVEWKALGSVNNPSSKSVRQLLAENTDALVNARYFAYGGVQNWSGGTIQLSQALVNSIEARNFTPLSNLLVDAVKVVGTPTLDPPKMVVDGGTWNDGSATGNTSENWLDRVSLTQGSLLSSTPIGNLFNGKVGNDATDPSTYIEFANTGNYAELTFDPPLTTTNGEAVLVYIGNGGSGFGGDGIWVNDAVVETPVPGNGSNALLFNTGAASVSKLRVEGSKNYRFSAIVMDGQELVDPNALGDTTISKSLSGTGEVLTLEPQDDTMTLTNSNDEWVEGYYVQTPQRPALSKTGYLKIDGNGNVTGLSHLPQPGVGIGEDNPTLTFPDTFDTGDSPDVEIPFPSGLKTTITQRNSLGSSTASSNQVFPETTSSTYTPAANSLDITTGEYAEFVAKVSSFEGRAATQRAATYSIDSAALENATETAAENYLIDNDLFQPPTTTTVAVTVAGGYYYIDGVQQDSITMDVGDTIVFDQSDSSNNGHPLAIYTTADKQAPAPGNINPSGTDVAYTPDTAGTFYYQCASHSNMGGSITVS